KGRRNLFASLALRVNIRTVCATSKLTLRVTKMRLNELCTKTCGRVLINAQQTEQEADIMTISDQRIGRSVADLDTATLLLDRAAGRIEMMAFDGPQRESDTHS
ncbi:MAG TPA: hypothetical protein PK992_13445, partial [Planctomycetaceae bacterium]|nr:hypothetical protein [Planctomycetaceae bacterium]